METKNPLTAPVLAAFGLAPDTPYKPLLSGHINDTYLVQAPGRKLTLQRINHFVFPSPENIMENILGVTSFLREKIAAQGGDPDRETLTVVPTVEGKSFARTRRATTGGAPCTWTAPPPTRASRTCPCWRRRAGPSGGSSSCCATTPPTPSTRSSPISTTPRPGTGSWSRPRRKTRRPPGRGGPELDFARARKQDCALLMDLLAQGELPLRVTHNDTKLSNVLLDDTTGKAVCVIDLDT